MRRGDGGGEGRVVLNPSTRAMTDHFCEMVGENEAKVTSGAQHSVQSFLWHWGCILYLSVKIKSKGGEETLRINKGVFYSI